MVVTIAARFPICDLPASPASASVTRLTGVVSRRCFTGRFTTRLPLVLPETLMPAAFEVDMAGATGLADNSVTVSVN